MNKWLSMLIATMFCAITAQGQWVSVDTWDFDADEPVPLSENGVDLGNTYETNYQVVAQIPDDNLFIFSPEEAAKFGTRPILSEVIDLNSNKVRMVWTYDSVDFSSNATANAKHGIRLKDADDTRWIGLSMELNANNGTVFAFASDSEGIISATASKGKVGRLVGSEGADADISRTFTIELDYRKGKIFVYSDQWQWTAGGEGPVYEFDYDFRGMGFDNIGRIQPYYSNWETGSRVVQDRIAVEAEEHPQGVYIETSSSYESKNVAETNTFANLDVVDGDWIVVMAAVNNAAWDDGVIKLSGSAAPASMNYEEVVGSGPRTATWYAPVPRNGEVDITLEVPEGQESRASLAAYVIRSASGDVDILSTASVASGSAEEADFAYTNVYEFPLMDSGVYVETIAAYANGFSVENADFSIDYANSSGNRIVGSGRFFDAGGMTNVWSTVETNRQAAVFGMAFVSGLLPEERFAAWIGAYPGVGELTDMLDDPDGDGLDNLTEYAFGGSPEDASDRGNYPMQAIVTEEGVDYFEYVHYERTDALNRGLYYDLYVGSNLMHTDWSQEGIEYIGSGEGPAGFKSVTNRISTADGAVRFLDLNVTFEP